MVYYGTEVGLSQRQAVGRLEEARLPMPREEEYDRDLLHFYRRLIALRRQSSAVWSLPRQTLLVDDARGLYAYRCGAWTVYLNNSDQPVDLACAETESMLATDAAAALQAHQLRLPPFAGIVLK